MDVINKIQKVVYEKFLTVVVIVIGMTMAFSVSLQVLGRYVMKTPFPWTEELARLCYVWFALLGSALTLSQNGHLGVDYFFRKFDDRIKKVLELATWVIVIAACAIVLNSGIKILAVVAKQHTAILRISYVWSYSSVPTAAGFMGFYGILSLVKALFYGWRRDTQS